MIFMLSTVCFKYSTVLNFDLSEGTKRIKEECQFTRVPVNNRKLICDKSNMVEAKAQKNFHLQRALHRRKVTGYLLH